MEQGVSLEYAKSKCISDPECKGFRWYPSAGFVAYITEFYGTSQAMTTYSAGYMFLYTKVLLDTFNTTAAPTTTQKPTTTSQPTTTYATTQKPTTYTTPYPTTAPALYNSVYQNDASTDESVYNGELTPEYSVYTNFYDYTSV